MTLENLPKSAADFNNKVSQGDITIGDFWSLEWDTELIPKIYSKELITYVKYDVYGYVIIGVFQHKEGKKDFYNGEYVKIYAIDSILKFIYEVEPEYFNKSLRSDFYKNKNEILKKQKYHRYYNTIYIDGDFEKIISKLSTFFHEEGLYPVLSNDRVSFSTNLKDIWNENENFLFHELCTSSDLINSLDNIVDISLVNTHDRLANCLFSDYYGLSEINNSEPLNEYEFPIPDVVFENCIGVPHFIKIGYAKGRFNQQFEEILENKFFKQFVGDAYFLSSDFSIIGQKPNKYIRKSERSYFLYERTENYFDNITLENNELDIQLAIGNIWDDLHLNSKKFLSTGYFLFKKTKSGSDYLLDTSIASLTFAKCIENEMVQRIVLPFKLHYQEKFINEDLSKDLNDFNLKKMTKFLIEKDSTPPELGSFAYFLKNVLNSKKRAKWSVSIRAFKSFCDTCENPGFLLSEKELYHKLFLIAKKYRNGGAHIKVLPIEYVQEFYDMLFGSKEKFLEKLISSTKLKNS